MEVCLLPKIRNTYSMVEIQFPKVLIPTTNIICYISHVILTFLFVSYYGFYRREKRKQRAKKMGIIEPIEIIVDYGLKINEKLKDSSKTNQVALYNYFYEYLARPEHKESDWKFDIKDFEKEALPLFTDIPSEIRGSFILYELKLLAMESEELRETIRDSIGYLPEGSKLFDKIMTWLFYVWIIIILLMGIFWSPNVFQPVLYAILGVGVGFALGKLNRSEDRYQFWHMIWFSVIILFVNSHYDGYLFARSDLLNSRLPIATFSKINGDEEKGILIASFSDCYFIIPSDPNYIFRRIKIEKSDVRSINYITADWLIKEIQYRKHLKNLSKDF